MSRDRNNLQRHIEDCLADHREMRERYECELIWNEEDPTWWEWGDETLGAPELEEWDMAKLEAGIAVFEAGKD